MSRGQKKDFRAAARAAGGFALARRLTARSLRVLCYHGIWTEPGAATPTP